MGRLEQWARGRAGRLIKRVRASERPIVQNTYNYARTATRRVVNTLTHSQLGWVGTLRAARWVGPTSFEIVGWAYERGRGYERAPKIRVWLQADRGDKTIEAQVTPLVEEEINAMARLGEYDYANTAFRARFELADLPELRRQQDGPRRWVTMVRVEGGGKVVTGRLKYRMRTGSARFLSAHTLAHDEQILPWWQKGTGLAFTARRPRVVADQLSVDDRTLTATVRTRGVTLVSAELIEIIQDAEPHRLPVTLEGDGHAYRLSVVVPYLAGADSDNDDDDSDESENEPTISATVDAGAPDEDDSARSDVGEESVPTTGYVLSVTDDEGRVHNVACRLDDGDPVTDPGSTLLVYPGPDAEVCLRAADALLVIDAWEFQADPEPVLTVRGRSFGDVREPVVELSGKRQVLPGEMTWTDESHWQASLALTRSEWGQRAMPLRPGSYALQARRHTDGALFRVSCSPNVVAETPVKLPYEPVRLRIDVDGRRRLRLKAGVKRAADELGSFQQRRLLAAARRTRYEPREAVYFESFYGRSATCNPYAIDREIARRFPDLPRYWGVTDASVVVPEGAIQVIEGTKEWFEARGSCRWVVANDWLRRRFTHQPFQTVLQTWHGSMLKRIGLDRPTTDRSARRSLLIEQNKWDVLLSQNRHSSEIFGSAYAWDRTLFEEGYPRNDVLAGGDGAALREMLGIRPDQTAVLYAPTWRDNADGLVMFLDLALLSAALGEQYVVLLRGHTRTGHFGVGAVPGVIDVTTYPHVSDLFLAADAMITDYSSVMFDFSATGKPMIFFVPDIEQYRDKVRGVYFDLSEQAPGPVVMTQVEVTRAVRNLPQAAETYAERYAPWRERFNHLDDGHSAQRVVDRLFSEAPFPRPQGR